MEELKSCPYCGEFIKSVAIKCKYCKSDLIDTNGTVSSTSSELQNEDFIIDSFLRSKMLLDSIQYNRNRYLNKWGSYPFLKVSYSELLKSKSFPYVVGWNWAAFFFNAFWGVWRGLFFSWGIIALTSLQIIYFAFYPEKVFDYFLFTFIYGLFVGLFYGIFGDSLYFASLLKFKKNNVPLIKPSVLNLIIAFLVVFTSNCFFQYKLFKYFSEYELPTSSEESIYNNKNFKSNSATDEWRNQVIVGKWRLELHQGCDNYFEFTPSTYKWYPWDPFEKYTSSYENGKIIVQFYGPMRNKKIFKVIDFDTITTMDGAATYTYKRCK